MSLSVFPSTVRGLTYPVEKQSEFNTLVQSAPNLLETTVSQTYNPCWRWQMIYEFLYDDPKNLASGLAYTDYRVLQGFILAQGGIGKEFLFTDPKDNSVGPAMISGSPNTQAQLQLVSDGAGTFYSPIQRNFGGQFYEDITDLNGSIVVYANGVLQSVGNYQLLGPGLALTGSSYMGMYLKWLTGLSAPPAPTLSAVAGGTLAATTYFVKIAYVGTAGGTSAASIEASLAVPLDDLLQVASPAAHAGATGYNVYVSTASGAEMLQNASPIAIGTAWTEPTTGLVSGVAAPAYNTVQPTGPITAQFNFYFRVRFGSDKHDFTQFLDEFWTMGGSDSTGSTALEIKSSRPVLL